MKSLLEVVKAYPDLKIVNHAEDLMAELPVFASGKEAADFGIALFHKKEGENMGSVCLHYNGRVVGILTYGPTFGGRCWDAKAIGGVASIEGKRLGDILVLLGAFYAGRLVMDRRSVTAPAKKLWKRMIDRGDLVTAPLDDIKNPQTVPTQDDCELHPEPWLNQAILAASRPNYIGKMNINHMQYMSNPKAVSEDSMLEQGFRLFTYLRHVVKYGKPGI